MSEKGSERPLAACSTNILHWHKVPIRVEAPKGWNRTPKAATPAAIKSLPLPDSATLSEALERNPRCLDNLTNDVRKRFGLVIADAHNVATRIAV